ncbi:histidinol-phosphate transaminase [Kaistia geumhonensis]|uniref:Histidinol-phosphate aminotransferase n=1 Tax=Kaistia geumhonensis TaxID=410839 RepID=A0ABU0MC27_9HYPH|nr:histidinol-phosphate transaminase [Kaistia geumhonensis]MCX5481460.1 histidinol-phosphate transaminase [Kaistia geumhonensis]MDQ0518525.1 histidinol-phosphate aminotransferase [Kaistia geumhonensis]
MSRFWSPIVSTLKPYVPGEQPKIANLVKLNTNESPYGPSPKALAAIAEAAGDALRLYPDPTSMALREAIAARHGLSAGEVFVGNGSDEVLAHAFMGLLKHEKPLLYPDISYSFYPVYCGLYGIEAVEIPLDDAFRIRVADYDRPSGAVILPNPNAPTGIALPLAEIEALLAQDRERLVVVDEAYVDFGAESAVSLVPAHDNLLVVQTFSKSRGLAGLRVGFAIGQRPLIEGLERVKDSFNSYPLDRLAIAGATAAYRDEAWFDDKRRTIMASRERVAEGLAALGFEVLPSSANFVFARHGQRAGADLAAALRARGVLVRHFAKPRIGDFLRISIGTDAECDRLLAELSAILEG